MSESAYLEQEVADAGREIGRLEDAAQANKTEIMRLRGIVSGFREEEIIESVCWEDIEVCLGLEGREVSRDEKGRIVELAAGYYRSYIDGCGDVRHECFGRALEKVRPDLLGI